MKALIIYNNFASAAKANAILQHSVQNADLAAQWRISAWRVDMLKLPPISEEALAESADAHLIVLVGRCAESLPLWLLDWLEQWAMRRQIEDVALAVIREERAGTFSTTAPELSYFAARHGLNLIFDSTAAIFPASIKESSSFTEGQPRESETTMTTSRPQTSDTRFRGEYRDWGINE